jgi:hypothetical protein
MTGDTWGIFEGPLPGCEEEQEVHEERAFKDHQSAGGP